MKKTVHSSNNLILTAQAGSRSVGEKLRTVVVSLELQAKHGPIRVNTEISLDQFDALQLSEEALGQAIIDQLGHHLNSFIFSNLKDKAVPVVNAVWDIRNQFDTQAKAEREALTDKE